MAERNVVDAPLTPAPEKASLFEDFIDIFFAPSKVFARRANSGFWLITLIVTLVSAVLLFAGSSTIGSLMESQMMQQQATMLEQNPSMTEEQLATMRTVGTTVGKAFMYIGTPILVILLGLVVWIVSKVFGAAVTYSAAAMIVAYSLVPRLLQSIAMIVQGLMLDPTTAGFSGFSFSPARFMDPATSSAGMIALMMRFDLFIIWGTILIGIGIAIVGKVPRGKGYLAAAAIWVVGTIPALWAFATT